MASGPIRGDSEPSGGSEGGTKSSRPTGGSPGRLRASAGTRSTAGDRRLPAPLPLVVDRRGLPCPLGGICHSSCLFCPGFGSHPFPKFTHKSGICQISSHLPQPDLDGCPIGSDVGHPYDG